MKNLPAWNLKMPTPPAPLPPPTSAARRALAALLLVLGLQVPGQATIILGGATPEEDARLKARAHQLALEHKNVVGLVFSKDNWAQAQVAQATGVYLGPSADGRTGLVLTSAHPWLEEADPDQAGKVAYLLVNFGPDNLMWPTAGKVQAVGLRVVFPFGKYASAQASADATGMTFSRQMPDLTDLAIVEFLLTPRRAQALAALGVAPARLYDGEGYRAPLLEGLISGYGLFGTSHGARLGNAAEKQPHAGYTRVSYGLGRTGFGFLHWSPYAPEGEALIPEARKGEGNLNEDQFLTVAEPEVWHDERSGAKVQVRSHPRQTLIAAGDSGGPLFFNTRKGLALAGIASHSGDVPLVAEGGAATRLFIRQMWVPVKAHRAWIEAVRAGSTGGCEVMEVTGAAELRIKPQL